tara:strand:- start:949 stop:2472 length:1524 start_codon:yes stop_codon:yes gene_type:complete
MKSKKIITIENLKRKNHKKNIDICLTHGVFDFLHVGHKRYLEKAKSYGDLLIVSITTDKYVNKGPSRPIFNEYLRAEMIASLEAVDYVILNDAETAVNIINQIKPNFYVKGKDYKNLKGDLTKNIYKEKNAVEKNGGKIVFTEEIQFSSSSIINNFYKPEAILNEIKRLKFDPKYFSEMCLTSLKEISSLKVAIVGEIIFDEYIFSKEMDKPSKENIHAVNFKKKENYLGGVLAIAKNLSQFSKKIDIYSSGSFNLVEKKLIQSIKSNFKNISLNLEKSDFQTIKKTRILNEENKKIFEIYYKNGSNKYSKNKNFLKTIERKFDKYDVVMICDFGHGFFCKKVYEKIIKKSKKVSINVQTNSDNRGFNLITKYKKGNLVSIDEPEIRLALSDRHSNIETMSKNLSKKIKFDFLVVTRGNSGITIFKKNGQSKFKSISLPAFELRPLDTIGAGDTVFGIVSLLQSKKVDIAILAFLGNMFGAFATRYLGHSSYIKRNDIIKAITYSLK